MSCKKLNFYFTELEKRLSSLWRLWLNCCAVCVCRRSFIFHWHYPSVRTMALKSTQKWVSGHFVGGKGGRCVGVTTLPPSGADCSEIWERQPVGTLRVCAVLFRVSCTGNW